jgi:hypothetical protein
VQTLDPKKPAIEQRWSDDDHDDAPQDATEQGPTPQRESDPSTEGKSQPSPPRPTA